MKNNAIGIMLLLIGLLVPVYAMPMPKQSTSITKSKKQSQLIELHSREVINHPHRWRLIYAVNGSPVRYHLLHLHKPNRIVITIAHAKLLRQFSFAQLMATPIKKIRSASHGKHQLHLVFDMSADVQPKIMLAPAISGKPSRLVIDLIGKRNKIFAFTWPQKKNKTVASARNVIIMIDPGHGGKDPGATGPGGTHEKTIVLAIARKLQHLINQHRGFVAYLTRHGDYYLTLRQRLAIARQHKADMFVAIHADAWKNRSASGASVFALSRRGATSEAAHWLAARENKSELMGGVNLADKTNLLKSVLINLSQTATIHASIDLGRDIIDALHRVTHLHHGRVEQAAFVVLKSPDIPSLLIETGFLSNTAEERRLKTPSYRYHLASAIAHGICAYFTQRPPRGTWLVLKKHHKKIS